MIIKSDIYLTYNSSKEIFYEHNKHKHDIIDVTVFSCKNGCKKPAKRLYGIVLDRLKIYPLVVDFYRRLGRVFN